MCASATSPAGPRNGARLFNLALSILIFANGLALTTVRLKAGQIQLVSGIFVVSFAGIGLERA